MEKYFEMNISSVVFHSQEASYGEKKTLHLRPSYIRAPRTCTKNLNAVKVGAEARKKKHYMQLKLHPF